MPHRTALPAAVRIEGVRGSNPLSSTTIAIELWACAAYPPAVRLLVPLVRLVPLVPLIPLIPLVPLVPLVPPAAGLGMVAVSGGPHRFLALQPGADRAADGGQRADDPGKLQVVGEIDRPLQG